MARKSKAQVQMDRIEAAMIPLVGIPQFADFMALVTDLKNEAVAFSVDSDTVKSDRESLVVKGEIRCYINLENIYRGQLEQVEAKARHEEEQRSIQAQQ
jgi:hypothetical protein